MTRCSVTTIFGARDDLFASRCSLAPEYDSTIYTILNCESLVSTPEKDVGRMERAPVVHFSLINNNNIIVFVRVINMYVCVAST